MSFFTFLKICWMGVALSQDFPTEDSTIPSRSIPRVALKPTIPPFEFWKTLHVTCLTANSVRAERNNADHTCIWSCSTWVDRAVPDACQILHANRTNSGQSTRLHVADFFGADVGCEEPRSEVSVTARHRRACG